MPARRFWPRLAFALLLPALARPEAVEYSHRVWRTDDGLPQDRVQAITQTPDGYLWIGTSEGLARFDGVRFAVFDRSNTAAIADNSILSLQVARDGSLWVGTEGGGLLHYEKGVFRAFGQKEGLTNGFVRAIHLDRAGTLWAGTDHGFFRYASGRFTRLDGTPEIPFVSVYSIVEDRGGKMWLASAAGLLAVEGGSLRKITCDGARARSSGLTVAMLREGLLADACGAPDFALPEARISSLHRDTSGNLWIGTTGEGLISVPAGRAAMAHRAPSFLPDNTILVLFEDRQHNIWAGAQDGLLRLSRTAVTTIAAAQGLSDDNVSTTYEDREGRLWIVTFSGQVYRLKGTTPERYSLPPPARDLRIRTVFEARNGDFWFGASGAGLVRLSHGKVARYTKKEGLRSDSVRQIFEDSRGAFWIATSSGLSRWDGAGFTNYYLEEGLSYPSVRCLAESPEGDVLVGTDAGLNRIRDGHIVNDPAFASLRQEKIWSLLVDGKDLWLGTRGGGLILIRRGKLTRFTTREGLVSNSIYQILDDRRGRLWMSSPTGVFSVRRDELNATAAGKPAPLHAVAYGTPDGMPTSQMYGGIQPAGCRRSSGELWFPSVLGAVMVDPGRQPERRPAPVLIESVSAGDVSLPISKEVVIPSGRSRLQIDFTACDLIAPQRVSFLYRLEGFDESWTRATRPRSAFYSNLPPGHYRFRVVADAGGVPGASSEASIAIYWKPAFYQTVWFYALLGALVICCAWGGMWIYARQTKARYSLLLSERTRLAREMHDTVIQGCVGVSTLLDAAARYQRSNLAEASSLLAQARMHLKATLEEARQAVWDLRHSSPDQSSIHHLFDLARKLGNDHGANVSTEIEGERLPLDPATGRALLLVGREALRNSVAHANPAKISVRVSFGNAGVQMEVRDDGHGFDVERASRESNGHFGIIGMRERVEQLGGAFSLRSQPGAGTIVTVALPAQGAPDQNSTIPR
ncbi:MAG TPA: two-component regulator propeller domain-containing protein [Bryobacteraceae bacterium]|nr:two-component regulator propeller domain-containing protein [Bryobacteraceae bacterium]